MVEIRDAIRYHDSPAYLRRWADRILGARPDARVFLYETWHPLDDPEGWLNRLDRDLGRYWEGELLARAQADGELPQAIRVIPAGQVMARFVRAVEARGGVDGIAGAGDLFTDTIHLERRRDIPRRPHPLRRALPAQPGRPAAAAHARRRHAGRARPDRKPPA